MATVATVITLVCLGLLFLHSPAIVTFEPDIIKAIRIVGAAAAFVWAALVLF